MKENIWYTGLSEGKDDWPDQRHALDIAIAMVHRKFGEDWPESFNISVTGNKAVISSGDDL